MEQLLLIQSGQRDVPYGHLSLSPPCPVGQDARPEWTRVRAVFATAILRSACMRLSCY
jgi:hypothetical protein